MPDCPSGQWERTVNPSACAYVGSNPTSGTDNTHRSYFGGCFLHSPGWLAAGRLAKTVVLRWASWGFDRAGPTNQQFLSRGAGGPWAPLRGGERNRWFAKPVLGLCGATTDKPTKTFTGPRSWGILQPFIGRTAGDTSCCPGGRRGARASGSGWGLRRDLRAISLGVRGTACFKRVLGC